MSSRWAFFLAAVPILLSCAEPNGQSCERNSDCLKGRNSHGGCVFGYCESGTCTRDCSKDDVCPEGSQCVAAGGPNIEGAPFKRCE